MVKVNGSNNFKPNKTKGLVKTIHWYELNIELSKNAKNGFSNKTFQVINNPVFVKTIENVRKHRDIKLLAAEKTYTHK